MLLHWLTWLYIILAGLAIWSGYSQKSVPGLSIPDKLGGWTLGIMFILIAIFFEIASRT